MQEEIKQPKEDLKTKVNRLKLHVGDYVNTFTQIAKAKAVRGASNATAGVIIGITAFFFAFFFLFFVGFGLGWWLGTLFNNMAAGFFCSGGIVFIINRVDVCTSQKTDCSYDSKNDYLQSL